MKKMEDEEVNSVNAKWKKKDQSICFIYNTKKGSNITLIPPIHEYKLETRQFRASEEYSLSGTRLVSQFTPPCSWEFLLRYAGMPFSPV